MQLGARWRAGEPPHRSVPPALHSTIAEQEAAHPAADSWTLTWLEGRPRCALAGAVIVSLDAAGRVVVLAGPEGPAGSAAAPEEDTKDADDEDWLS